jgi:hypothetical protein
MTAERTGFTRWRNALVQLPMPSHSLGFCDFENSWSGNRPSRPLDG